MCLFFFFFQAEDGIRDLTVTGVQTCALPISAYVEGNFPPPFADKFGYELTTVEPGKVVIETDGDESHAHQWGPAFGGVIAALADATWGFVSLTTMEKGQTGGFLEMKINYLKAITKTRLKAIGTMKKRGRTVALTECDVLDSDGGLVAYAVATIVIRN